MKIEERRVLQRSFLVRGRVHTLLLGKTDRKYRDRRWSCSTRRFHESRFLLISFDETNFQRRVSAACCRLTDMPIVVTTPVTRIAYLPVASRLSPLKRGTRGIAPLLYGTLGKCANGSARGERFRWDRDRGLSGCVESQTTFRLFQSFFFFLIGPFENSDANKKYSPCPGCARTRSLVVSSSSSSSSASFRRFDSARIFARPSASIVDFFFFQGIKLDDRIYQIETNWIVYRCNVRFV